VGQPSTLTEPGQTMPSGQSKAAGGQVFGQLPWWLGLGAAGTVSGMQKVVAGQSGWEGGWEQGISPSWQVDGQVGAGQEPLGWHQSPL
jgi:hypothetical protein